MRRVGLLRMSGLDGRWKGDAWRGEERCCGCARWLRGHGELRREVDMPSCALVCIIVDG